MEEVEGSDSEPLALRLLTEPSSIQSGFDERVSATLLKSVSQLMSRSTLSISKRLQLKSLIPFSYRFTNFITVTF